MIRKKAPLSQAIVDSAPSLSLSIAVKKARGSYLYDYNNNKYLDLYLNQGACILGYANKNLSQNLKNELSRGFLTPYPHHLQNRAKTSVRSLLLGLLEQKELIEQYRISFFRGKHALLTNLQLLGATHSVSIHCVSLFKPDILNSPSIKDYLKHPCGSTHYNILWLENHYTALSTIKNIESYSHIVIGSVLANGLPIYCALEPPQKLLEEHRMEEENLLPLEAQAIIQTTDILKKTPVEEIFKKVLNPYQKLIEYLGQGCFKLKKNISQEEIFKDLLVHCIFVDHHEPIYFLNLQISPESLKYFFNCLKKIS